MTKAAYTQHPGLPVDHHGPDPDDQPGRPDRATRLAIAARAVLLCVGLFAASGAWS